MRKGALKMAGQANPPEELVRIQRCQVRVALPWAARALGLPPLDGNVCGAGNVR